MRLFTSVSAFALADAKRKFSFFISKEIFELIQQMIVVKSVKRTGARNWFLGNTRVHQKKTHQIYFLVKCFGQYSARNCPVKVDGRKFPSTGKTDASISSALFRLVK